MHLETTVAEFYAKNGIGNFIDRMAAFLKIPINRIKVVNIRSGSVYVDY